MRVRWLRRALQNLEAEAAYIAQDNPQASVRLVKAVGDAVALLAEHPALGRPGRIAGTRELVIPDYPYLVPYRVRADTVQVLRVFHTSRKPPEHW